MVIVQWRESYETGVEEMDNEHKALIDIINQLYEILREKRPQEELRQIYGKLLDCAKNHFSHEVDLLRGSNYAAFAEQCRAQTEFIEKLKGDCKVNSLVRRKRQRWKCTHFSGNGDFIMLSGRTNNTGLI